MPSTLTLQLLLHTLLIPALAVLIGLGVAAALGVRRYAAAFALTAGALAGYVGVAGWPVWPPGQALAWYPLLLPAVLIVYAVVENLQRSPFWRRGPEVLCILLVVGLLAAPLLRYGRWRGEVVDLIALPLLWFAAASAAPRTEEGAAPVAVAFVAAAGNAVIAPLCASVLVGQLSAALAVSIATLGVTALWRRRPFDAGARGVALAALAMLLVVGRLYGDTPLWATVLLFVPFVLPPIVEVIARRFRPRAARRYVTLVTLLLAALPLAIAVGYLAATRLHPGEF